MANEETLVDYLKWVTADLHEAQERLRVLEEGRAEPIAIVGMSCRFPGGVGSPEDLWRLVVTGTDAVSGFPTDRGWDLDALAERAPVREGGFLDGADRFDPAFFGISPREALTMDPQQRLLLETGWETLERAGIDPHSLRGSKTGVFVGSNNQDHVIVLSNAADDVTGYGLTGSTASVLSGRVAYFLGLEGPAVTVDTACSSSLVSLHLAAQSLRLGECTLALAGGVALMATPAMFTESNGQGALSSDGRCKAFAEGADGTGWGEGVGWVLLERLSEAKRNGHEILAVVTGSAVNQDGASNGLTAPNGPSQQRVIRAALDSAGLTPSQVDAVEAHGTGTKLGDPIEAGAVLETYGGDRAHPLLLGSLKSNIGHTQAAAGVGGVIKMVMALRNGVAPKTLHVGEPTSQVDWSSGNVQLLTESVPWPETGQPHRAAVSSFGVSGTNAHVIIEQAPERDDEPETIAPAGILPWVLSARTDNALRELAARLKAHVEANPELSLVDVAYSLAQTRSRFTQRAVVLGADRDELLAGLDALAGGESSAAVVTGTARYGDRVVFVFPGYGSQWPGMALELFETEPVFRDAFLACNEAFTGWIDFSLVDVLRQADGAPDLDRLETAQLMLFAVHSSLAAVWRAYGVEPSAVIGHSQGEITAAYVTGAVSLEDAARVVASRSRLLQTVTGDGGMVSVPLSHGEVVERIKPYGERISVAVINGPRAVVVSGDADALDELRAELTADGVDARKLPMDIAGHSAHIDRARDGLAEELASLHGRPTDITFFSTVTGTRVDTAGLDGAHWFRNVRNTVYFEQATRAALEQGYRMLVEVSAHPVLSVGLQDVIEDNGVDAVGWSTLRRQEGGRERFLRALAAAHVNGADIDFDAVFAGTNAKRVLLPTYAFQHDRYRLEMSATSGDASSLGLTPAEHPMVDAEIELPETGGVLLTGRLSQRGHSWLADHVVLGTAIAPGTAHLELAFRAGEHLGCDRVDELTLQAPLVLPAHGGVAVQVFVGGVQDNGQRSVAVYSRPDVPGEAAVAWTCHATGWLSASRDVEPADDLTQWPPNAAAVDLDGCYDRLAAAGLDYGPAYQGLRAAWARGKQVYAEVVLPQSLRSDAERFGLHPALLDAAFHALFATHDGEPMRMLFSWSGLRLLATGAAELRVRLTSHADDKLSVLVADADGAPVLTVESVFLREVTADALSAAAAGETPAPKREGRRPLRRAGASMQPSSTLARQLSALAPPDRIRKLVDLVRTEAAVVLGYADAQAIPTQQAFRELGFTSITAVELRSRLKAVTGLPLPASLVFDYPSADALGTHLLELVLGDGRQAEAAAVRRTDDEPIAIVGMSCRFPGGVSSPEDLWRLVVDGVDASSELPGHRGWDLAGLVGPNGSTTRRGGFLADPARFDATFFGISAREALAMDPQQRLLMETAWESLEQASIDPATLRGSNTGVFVGSNGQDHALLVANGDDELAGYRATGVSASVMSGRVSYTFGLEGPALTVDTACSSSLVSLHLAAESLQRGECTLALAGGCSVLSTPTQFLEFSKQGALAADGRSKAYSAGADGFAMSEGVGWLVLERLSDARRNRHQVLAVVRGSAVNQDGASNGLTAPNGPSQERVIRQALANAGLEPSEVDAVEGHGTGTALGDPIEVQALLATYGQDRAHPLLLGSLKSNIGHAQAAAGVGGVIKTVLALRSGVLPKTLHVTEPTPEVDWSTGAVELLTESVDWPETGRPRRAGVSSFGISGTNAHVLLEAAPEVPVAAAEPASGLIPWVISAKSQSALKDQAARLVSYLETHEQVSVADVGLSLLTARSSFDHRAVVVGRGRDELVAGLRALATGGSAANLVEGVARRDSRVAFVFPGQGTQWEGMAAELLATSPVFAEAFTACATALSGWVDWSPLDVLRGVDGAPSLDRVDVVQPMLWAVMVSLTALWRSYGVEPSAVIGHSQGEIAAATATGALSIADGAKVVALRSRALIAISGRGGMMSVQLGRDELEPRLAPWGERISVAAVNGPRAVVVSGEPLALKELQAALSEGDITARIIPVSYAAHSAHVDAIRDELAEALASLRSNETTVPFFSCVAGEQRGTGDLDAEYWHQNLRETVLFDRATHAVLASGTRLVLEVSPHPVLVMAVQDVIDDSGLDAVAWGTLRRNEGGAERFLLALAQAHVSGAAVDFSSLFAGAGVVDVPTYAFQGERYWLVNQASTGDATSLGLVASKHPMVTAEVPLPDTNGTLFTGRLSVPTLPWIGDHVVSGMTILPGTGFIELGLHAAEHVGCARIEELTVQTPLLFNESGGWAVQVVVAPPVDSGQRQLTVYSRPETVGDDGDDEDWTCHVTGWLSPDTPQPPEVTDLMVWPPRNTRYVSAEEIYEQLVAHGYGYGPTFQGLRGVWVRGDEVYAEVSLPQDERVHAHRYGMHPALFDAAFHALIAGKPRVEGEPLRLPFNWSGVRLYNPGAPLMRLKMVITSEETLTVTAVDETGRLVLSVDTLQLREIAAQGVPTVSGGNHRALFRLDWAPLTLPTSVPSTGAWVVLGDSAVSMSLTQADSSVRCHAQWSDLDAADAVPDILVLPVDTLGGPVEGTDVPGAVRRVTGQVLELVQQWLADDRFTSSRLVVVTSNAVNASGDIDVVQAAVWGLLRSAQSENPDRLLLFDVDEDEDSLRLIPRAVAAAVAVDEFQVAVRNGVASVARLGRVPVSEPTGQPRELDSAGTVLITGASGMLARYTAKHLVATTDVRNLLLVSRRGEEAPTIPPLVRELTELGATVTVAACDVADARALKALLDAIPAEHPLTGVVHSAGLVDDGVIGSLDRARLDKVFRPKVDAVWHLHELTRHLDLAQFTIFSSAAGTLGGGGQGGYAAANAFLDAMAAHRRSSGLAGSSLAWGAWEADADTGNTGLAGHLTDHDRGRMGKNGLLPFGFVQGMALHDVSVRLDDPFVLPMRLNIAAVRAAGRVVPPLLRALIRTVARRGADSAPSSSSSLADHLAALAGRDQQQFMIDLVRGQAAAVLGHVSAQLVPTDEAFRDLGYDSLTAVELRNRLKVTTGLTLPATLVFDHPTPRALAEFLLGELVPEGAAEVAPAQAEFDRLEAALAALPPDDTAAAQVTERLRWILSGWERNQRATEPAEDAAGSTDLSTASTDDLLAYIDNELGRGRD
ncbi:type I polyketide synthase [Streptomyces sp. 8L]|uniref:type I polyketide synthase n=1 Tax=Streptomyces sp. 8L TaxID=2877242 RepID=UPI001CD7D9BF|nr:type I polyketide synthase [Streptomyces sp. 8L]MCA1217798.1 SDR family NAD(P)-dependent oxidoreductase [Streptomyces sp. 8L]